MGDFDEEPGVVTTLAELPPWGVLRREEVEDLVTLAVLVAAVDFEV